MMTSDEWDETKHAKSVKGKGTVAIAHNASFWRGLCLCLKLHGGMFMERCVKLAINGKRILSLTTSTPGCQRNWSSFEVIHTKKRKDLIQ
ncbi:hypothetical protein OROGR_027053 [Orobanche gracilis]